VVMASFQALKKTVSPERLKGLKNRFSDFLEEPGQEPRKETEATPEKDGQP